ncbi:phosphate ABC transporter permease subunit PstC [Gloeocapsa sp. PCC 73106]|uniref:phosphate ABC transporter permease subunit PstC n=1 Tax=Gloeocapsa sp. PCC 73106 TaxID=102232 RepID=UPI0002AC053E|nr:phosphate ABC transporter permease subunit PstC [Gloeocapsa sp. PCC 73106]ELR98032.1 phosphate ABC transporter, permease protein PstC [Gloeocapsa sp. PCC 73106]
MTDQINDASFQRLEPRSAAEKGIDNTFKIVATICACGIALVLMWIILQILIAAWPAIRQFGVFSFLFGKEWNPVQNVFGIAPAILGTLVSSVIALAIAVPIGLGVAVFLSEDFINPKIQNIFVFLVQLLAAIPSVVYGLWGIFVLIPFLRPIGVTGASLLPASLVLAVMVLPTIASISRDAITNVPTDMRQAAVGLGATRWESILQIILPAASSGIIGAIMLGLGRALGETMAVTMLIGNSNRISFSPFAPSNTISALLANQFAEASGLQVSALMYAALVLAIITLGVNVLAQLVVTQLQKI